MPLNRRTRDWKISLTDFPDLYAQSVEVPSVSLEDIETRGNGGGALNEFQPGDATIDGTVTIRGLFVDGDNAARFHQWIGQAAQRKSPFIKTLTVTDTNGRFENVEDTEYKVYPNSFNPGDRNADTNTVTEYELVLKPVRMFKPGADDFNAVFNQPLPYS